MNYVNFIKRKNWTLQNDSLKAIFNKLIIKDGNIKLFESIVNIIKSNNRIIESVSMSPKFFTNQIAKPLKVCQCRYHAAAQTLI